MKKTKECIGSTCLCCAQIHNLSTQGKSPAVTPHFSDITEAWSGSHKRAFSITHFYNSCQKFNFNRFRLKYFKNPSDFLAFPDFNVACALLFS